VKGKSVVHAMLDIKPDKVGPCGGNYLVTLSATGAYLALAQIMDLGHKRAWNALSNTKQSL
jgi:hypothetical protein